VILNPGCFLFGDHFLSTPFSSFGTNTNNSVEIGDFVMFGSGSTIQGGNHDREFQGFAYLNKGIDHAGGVLKLAIVRR